QTQLASGASLRPDAPQALRGQPGSQEGESLAAGTPVAVDAGGRAQLRDPSDSPGNGAGTGASGLGGRGQTSPVGQAAENVFVPGRVGNGPTDQDLVDQPFTVRGAPRPYRDVLSQYAQTTRDYVERPDISPAVRQVMIALLRGGHVLLEGVPGLGKTLLVKTLGQVLSLRFSRIQFTPDLMPADIVGTTIVSEDLDGRRTLRFQAGPVFANLVL